MEGHLGTRTTAMESCSNSMQHVRAPLHTFSPAAHSSATQHQGSRARAVLPALLLLLLCTLCPVVMSQKPRRTVTAVNVQPQQTHQAAHHGSIFRPAMAQDAVSGPLSLSVTLSFLGTFYQDVLPALEASARHEFSEVWHPGALGALDAAAAVLKAWGLLSVQTPPSQPTDGQRDTDAPPPVTLQVVPSALQAAEVQSAILRATAEAALKQGAAASGEAAGAAAGSGWSSDRPAGDSTQAKASNSALSGIPAGLPATALHAASQQIPEILSNLWGMWADVCRSAALVHPGSPSSQLMPSEAMCTMLLPDKPASVLARCKGAASHTLWGSAAHRDRQRLLATRAATSANKHMQQQAIFQPQAPNTITRTAFPITRRVVLATLHALQISSTAGLQDSALAAQFGADIGVWGQEALDLFSRIDTCAKALKPAAEVLHVSKSGGTSLCELARLGGRRSTQYNSVANCKLPDFGLGPRWCSATPSFVPQACRDEWWHKPSVNCGSGWDTREYGTCELRLQVLTGQGTDWHMNEAALFGGAGTADPTASHLCPAMLNAAVIREPLQRLTSHMMHMIQDGEAGGARKRCMEILEQSSASSNASMAAQSRGTLHTAQGSDWKMPRDIREWLQIAPAVLDNYLTRHLLGRSAHCRPLPPQLGSAFTRSEVAQAAARLLAFDAILITDESARPLSNAVLRLGMGWQHTLRDVAFRVLTRPHDDLEKDVGLTASWFPGGPQALLAGLNAWDSALYASIARPALLLDAAWQTTQAQARGELLSVRRPTLQRAREASRLRALARSVLAGAGMALQHLGKHGTSAPAAQNTRSAPGSTCVSGLCHDPGRMVQGEQGFMQYYRHALFAGSAEQAPAHPVRIDPRLLLFGAKANLSQDVAALFSTADLTKLNSRSQQ